MNDASQPGAVALTDELDPTLPPPCPDPDSRTTAALVAWANAHAEKRVAAERERCAKLCEAAEDATTSAREAELCRRLAHAIRAERGR